MLNRQNSDEVSVAAVIRGFKNYTADSNDKFLADIDGLKKHKSSEVKNFSNNSLNLSRDYNNYCDDPNNSQNHDMQTFCRLFSMVSQKPFMRIRSGGKWAIGELLAMSATSQFKNSPGSPTHILTDAQVEETYTLEPVNKMRVAGQTLRAIIRARTSSPAAAAAVAAPAVAAPAVVVPAVAAPAASVEGSSDEESVASDVKSIYSESSISSAHSASNRLQTQNQFRSLETPVVNTDLASIRSGSVSGSKDNDSVHSGADEISFFDHGSFSDPEFESSSIKNRTDSSEPIQASPSPGLFVADWESNFESEHSESESIPSSISVHSPSNFPDLGRVSPFNDTRSQNVSSNIKVVIPDNEDIAYSSLVPGPESKVIASNFKSEEKINLSGSGDEYIISNNQELQSQKKVVIDELNIISNKIKEKNKFDLVLKNNLSGLKDELRARINEVKALVDLDEHATESDRAVRGLRLDMLRASASLAGEHFRRINDANYTSTENKFLRSESKETVLDVNYLIKESIALKSYEINTNDVASNMTLKLAIEDNIKESTLLDSIKKLQENENKVKEIVANERAELINKMDEFQQKVIKFAVDLKNHIENDLAAPFILAAINNQELAKKMFKKEALETIRKKIEFQKSAPSKIDNLVKEEFYLNKAVGSVFERQEQNATLKRNLSESKIAFDGLEKEFNAIYK